MKPSYYRALSGTILKATRHNVGAHRDHFEYFNGEGWYPYRLAEKSTEREYLKSKNVKK